MGNLLSVIDMPRLSGIETPGRFYQVLREPAPLAGMAYPHPNTPWQVLFDAGFHWVVGLTGPEPAYDSSPVQILRFLDLEDLYSGLPPQDPERERRLIWEAVGAILEKLRAGEGVIVHCMGGTGRTGTVLGAVLRRLNFVGPEVVNYLDGLHRARGKPGWPESDWQAQLVQEQ